MRRQQPAIPIRHPSSGSLASVLAGTSTIAAATASPIDIDDSSSRGGAWFPGKPAFPQAARRSHTESRRRSRRKRSSGGRRRRQRRRPANDGASSAHNSRKSRHAEGNPVAAPAPAPGVTSAGKRDDPAAPSEPAVPLTASQELLMPFPDAHIIAARRRRRRPAEQPTGPVGADMHTARRLELSGSTTSSAGDSVRLSSTVDDGKHGDDAIAGGVQAPAATLLSHDSLRDYSPSGEGVRDISRHISLLDILDRGGTRGSGVPTFSPVPRLSTSPTVSDDEVMAPRESLAEFAKHLEHIAAPPSEAARMSRSSAQQQAPPRFDISMRDSLAHSITDHAPVDSFADASFSGLVLSRRSRDSLLMHTLSRRSRDSLLMHTLSRSAESIDAATPGLLTRFSRDIAAVGAATGTGVSAADEPPLWQPFASDDAMFRDSALDHAMRSSAVWTVEDEHGAAVVASPSDAAATPTRTRVTSPALPLFPPPRTQQAQRLPPPRTQQAQRLPPPRTQQAQRLPPPPRAHSPTASGSNAPCRVSVLVSAAPATEQTKKPGRRPKTKPRKRKQPKKRKPKQATLEQQEKLKRLQALSDFAQGAIPLQLPLHKSGLASASLQSMARRLDAALGLTPKQAALDNSFNSVPPPRAPPGLRLLVPTTVPVPVPAAKHTIATTPASAATIIAPPSVPGTAPQPAAPRATVPVVATAVPPPAVVTVAPRPAAPALATAAPRPAAPALAAAAPALPAPPAAASVPPTRVARAAKTSPPSIAGKRRRSPQPSSAVAAQMAALMQHVPATERQAFLQSLMLQVATTDAVPSPKIRRMA